MLDKPQVEFEAGDVVLSKAIGSRDAFYGLVVSRNESDKGAGHHFYHVKDGANQHWHRDTEDLKLVVRPVLP